MNVSFEYNMCREATGVTYMHVTAHGPTLKLKPEWMGIYHLKRQGWVQLLFMDGYMGEC